MAAACLLPRGPLASCRVVVSFDIMHPDRETTPALDESREFTVSGGCAVCEGPMTVRATPGSMRGYCGRCGWISRPLVWQQDGRALVAYPPLAAA